MTGDEPDPTEEILLRLMTDCDEALALGDPPAVPPDVPEDVRSQLERYLACMRWARRALQPATLGMDDPRNEPV